MRSKRSHEGYLYVDPGEGPPLSQAEIDNFRGELLGAGVKKRTEIATVTCSHCQVTMAVQPLRTRDRAYCPKCDHYICDGCAGAMRASGECLTLNQVLDVAMDAAHHDPERVQAYVDQLRRDVLG